jgi:uncharacterized membrane protein
VRGGSVLAGLLLAAGVALIVVGVLQRTAQFALVVFVPVFYSSSWELPGGVVLFLAGIFVASFAVAPEGGVELANGNGADEPSSGGFLLIGPLPIFFGSFRRISSRARWVVTILSVAVFVALIVLLALIW